MITHRPLLFSIASILLIFAIYPLHQSLAAQRQQDNSTSVYSTFETIPPQQDWTDELKRIRFELEHQIPDSHTIPRSGILFQAPTNPVFTQEMQKLRDELKH